jgi:glycosyltransferase involved in cell wall biosynthesis
VRASRRLERGTTVLMGWGALEEELRRLIESEGLTESVLLTPPVPREEVIANAASATIGLIPYEPVGLNNTYTTPNKLFDYMAAGLPVVASRLPELVRFVEGGSMGATFEPGDPTALAAAINGLLEDGGRYEAMKGRALMMSRRYTWELEAPKLLAIYDGGST